MNDVTAMDLSGGGVVGLCSWSSRLVDVGGCGAVDCVTGVKVCDW